MEGKSVWEDVAEVRRRCAEAKSPEEVDALAGEVDRAPWGSMQMQEAVKLRLRCELRERLFELCGFRPSRSDDEVYWSQVFAAAIGGLLGDPNVTGVTDKLFEIAELAADRAVVERRSRFGVSCG